MTTRQFYEALLIELNKVQAPAVLLEDFNYFGTKVIGQYVNKIYNLYDINQQKSDDLRVLKATAILTPVLNTDLVSNDLLRNTFEVYLPDDYVHILGCLVEYTAAKKYHCYNIGDVVQFNAKRLTADMFPAIVNNYYMRPTYKNPYFYINNVAQDGVYPINEIPTVITSGTVIDNFLIKFGTPTTTSLVVVKNGVNYAFTYVASAPTTAQFSDATTLKTNLERIGVSSIVIGVDLLINNAYAESVTSVTEDSTFLTISTGVVEDTTSLIERVPNYRYGNRSRVRMEIRYGKDDTLFVPTKLYVDYLRSPQFIRLTQEQIDEVEDTSQLLEFPDYVCQEITNDLVKLLLENASDPRLQSNIPVNQTIGNPQQQR